MQSAKRDVLRPEVGVPLEYTPILVQRELLNLDNAVAGLKEPARSFMAQIVEAKIVNFQDFAGAGPVRPDCFCVVGKDELSHTGLPFRNFECFACVLEPLMVAGFLSWVFQVTHHSRQVVRVVVAPFKPGNFSLSA